MRRCLDCGHLFDRSKAPGWRCPVHQRQADQARDKQRGNTTQRGYGAAHQAERARQLAAFTPGQPCARCGRPIASEADADLGHTDDRTGYRGLEHRRCNRGAARKPGRKARRNAPEPVPRRPPADQQHSEPEGSDDDWIGIA